MPPALGHPLSSLSSPRSAEGYTGSCALTAEMRPWDHCPSSRALAGIAPTCGGQQASAQTCALLRASGRRPSCHVEGKVAGIQVLTFPWATSSLWAAEAAFTRALVAAAMDLAASSICSSKFKDSSASCKRDRSGRERCRVRGSQGSRHSERRGGEGSRADLGFGPGLQLLQLLGCGLNGSRSSQEFILSDDCGVLWVHPFCSWWTKRGGKGLRQSREIRSSGQHAYCPQALASVRTLRMPSLSSLLEAELSPEQGFPFPACPWSPLTLHGLSSLDELSD